MYRVVRWFVLVAVAWGALLSLPGLARYLRMRQL